MVAKSFSQNCRNQQHFSKDKSVEKQNFTIVNLICCLQQWQEIVFTRIIFLHFLDRFGKQVRRTVDMITVTDKRKWTSRKCETYPNCGWCEWDKMCLAAELNSLAKYLHWKQIYGSENVRLHKMLLTRDYSAPTFPCPGNLSWGPLLGNLKHKQHEYFECITCDCYF